MIQGEQGVARISLCQRHLSDVVPLWDGEGELLLPFLWTCDGSEYTMPFINTMVTFSGI